MLSTQPYANGKVRVSGVRGAASFLRCKRDASVTDNGDGTIDILITLNEGEGAMVYWQDAAGVHATACTNPAPQRDSLQKQVLDLEARVVALEGR